MRVNKYFSKLFLVLIISFFLLLIGCNQQKDLSKIKIDEVVEFVDAMIPSETTSDILLFDEYADVSLLYESSVPQVIDNTGKVTPIEMDVIVCFTVTYSYNEFEFVKEYFIIVNGKPIESSEPTELESSIEDGIFIINENFNEINSIEYSTENYQKIIDYKNEYIEKITNALTISDIDVLILEFNDKVSLVIKEELSDLELAIIDGEILLNEHFDNIKIELYTTGNYQKIIDLKNTTITKIKASITIEEIDDLISEFDNQVKDIEKIETIDPLIERQIEDIYIDLVDVLRYDNKTIDFDLNLKSTSLYDSQINWIVSDESLISTSGKVSENISNQKVEIYFEIVLNEVIYEGLVIIVNINTALVTIDLPAYYNSINTSLNGSQLKLALRKLISVKSGTSYADLKSKTAKTDADPNRSGYIITIYSRQSVKAAWDGGTTWNREHVWPQSKSWFTTSGAGSDIHHLRPEIPSVNSSRGNKAFGVKTTSSSYYPGEEACGDVARIIFYLLTCYSESDSYKITNVCTSMELLLEWNEVDPVDDLERTRNEEAYKIQHNRNPFIDNADFANQIWDYQTVTLQQLDEEVVLVEVSIVYAIIEDINKENYL